MLVIFAYSLLVVSTAMIPPPSGLSVDWTGGVADGRLSAGGLRFLSDIRVYTALAVEVNHHTLPANNNIPL